MKTFKKMLRPKLLIGAVVILGLFVGGYFLLFGTDGDSGAGSLAGTQSGDKGKLPARPKFNPRPAPVVTRGVVDTARRVGRFAVAQARGTIRTPSRVRVRVSAAPKQTVTVNWQLGCFVNRRTAYGKGDYRTIAPNTRTIKLPTQGAVSCIATAGVQLTRDGEGRVKVSIIAG